MSQVLWCDNGEHPFSIRKGYVTIGALVVEADDAVSKSKDKPAAKPIERHACPEHRFFVAEEPSPAITDGKDD